MAGAAGPRHWIGVRKGWEAGSADPLGNLVSLPPSKLRTHALVVGATGSGKTNLLHHLVAQDVMLGHSFAVLDLRGDLVAAVTEICAGWVDPRKVRILDLRERDRPMGFDPLHGRGEPYFRALSVLDAIASESDSWGVQLAETLRNALMLLSEAGERLTSLEALLYDRAFLLSCLDRCATPPVVAFWQRFGDMSPDRQAALAMPVLNKVSLLLSTGTLRAILGHAAPVDLGSHLDTPGSVTLVSLAADETHAAGRMMGRLVLSAVCREIFARVGISESRRNPVRLYVDEFEHFGESEFEAILAEGRRFGLSLVLAHQTLAQLAPRMRSMILNNVGTKVLFRCGREDAATLSKDVTGDPKALDVASLDVGEAMLWTRQGGYFAIEVNAPIVRDVGPLSPAARRFAGHSRDIASPPVAPGAPSSPPPLSETPRDALPAERPVRTKSDLEDWLCG